jgi:hypothetical protein
VISVDSKSKRYEDNEMGEQSQFHIKVISKNYNFHSIRNNNLAMLKQAYPFKVLFFFLYNLKKKEMV